MGSLVASWREDFEAHGFVILEDHIPEQNRAALLAALLTAQSEFLVSRSKAYSLYSQGHVRC